jgi:hypothetical protein
VYHCRSGCCPSTGQVVVSPVDTREPADYQTGTGTCETCYVFTCTTIFYKTVRQPTGRSKPLCVKAALVYAQESGQISCDSDSLHRPCIFHFLLRFLRYVVILLTGRYVAILPSINKGSIHHIPPVNFPYRSRLKFLWKFSVIITNHVSFIAERRNFLRSLVKILAIFSSAFGEIIPFLVISKAAVTFDICSDNSTK